MADTWTMLSGYTPSDYVDTMVFEVVSATKKIKPLSGQTLVAGEKNSQYVRFELDRFWDGIDISAKNFSITYSLAGKYYGTSEAVSAEVSTDRLRFGWIVPEEACCIAGTLMFVLVIKSDGYVLKTQIAETPVVKSLDEESVVPEPTREAWYKEFQARVQADLDASQAALTSAQDALTRANAANDAASSALVAASETNLAAQDAIVVAKERYGSPFVANAGPEMVDTNRVYVFTGSESAYTYGHWYYYDNGVWNDGGVYNGNGVNTDKTLSIENMPSDAKKTGDEISELKSGLNDLDERVADLEAGGSGGMSKTAVNLLNTILGEAVYGTDQSANIELLYKELSNVKPVSITASLTSRALVGMQYSELTFEITATFDDESTTIVTEGYRVTTTGAVHSGSNTVTVRYRGVTTNVTFTAEQVVTHTITYNLTDVTSSNNTTVVVDGSHYSTVLSVPTDYGFDGCTVTMGGVDITATAYSNMGILITEVTGNVVITASATAYTYLDDLIRIKGKESVVIAYSDNYQTQISRVNYNGTVFVSEYPTISDCNLHWVITNNTDSAVSLGGVCMGAIPCNETYPPAGAVVFHIPYAVLCTNQSGTLEAGASIEGDYVLRAGHQLAYLAQASSGTGSAEKLTLRIRGNYRANEFSDYEAFQINNETPNYGAYRSVSFYSDNGETLIATKNGNKGKVTDTLSSGTYDVYARMCADYATFSMRENNLISGAVANATDNASNYAYGSNTTPSLYIWYSGQMTVSNDGMTIIAILNKDIFANGGYADFRFKEVNA